jgi:hypothetical protein
LKEYIERREERTGEERRREERAAHRWEKYIKSQIYTVQQDTATQTQK